MAAIYANENFPRCVVEDDADPQAFARRIDAEIRSVDSLEGRLLRVVRPPV
jgi:hypothetical protein